MKSFKLIFVLLLFLFITLDYVTLTEIRKYESAAASRESSRVSQYQSPTTAQLSSSAGPVSGDHYQPSPSTVSARNDFPNQLSYSPRPLTASYYSTSPKYLSSRSSLELSPIPIPPPSTVYVESGRPEEGSQYPRGPKMVSLNESPISVQSDAEKIRDFIEHERLHVSPLRQAQPEAAEMVDTGKRSVLSSDSGQYEGLRAPQSISFVPVLEDEQSRFHGNFDSRPFSQSIRNQRNLDSRFFPESRSHRSSFTDRNRERDNFNNFQQMNFNRESRDRNDDRQVDRLGGPFFREQQRNSRRNRDDPFGLSDFWRNANRERDSSDNRDAVNEFSGFGQFSRDSKRSRQSGDDFHRFSDFLKESKNNRENFDTLKENHDTEKFQDDHHDDHHYGGHYGHHHHAHDHHGGHYHNYGHLHEEKRHHHHGHHPIQASIDTKHSVETYHKKSKHHHKHHPVVDINSGPLPLTLRFNSHSSDIHAVQNHKTPESKIEKQVTVEEPDVLIKEIKKPIIQEIREIIQPVRQRTQEVRAVKERVETIIARDDEHKKHHKNHHDGHHYYGHHYGVKHYENHHGNHHHHDSMYYHDDPNAVSQGQAKLNLPATNSADLVSTLKNVDLVNSLAQSDNNVSPSDTN